MFFEQLTGCFLNPSQIRHPERSAARIYRITDGLCAKSKDPGDARWQMLFQAFRPRTTSQIKKVTSSERSRGICSFTQPATDANECATPQVAEEALFCIRAHPRGKRNRRSLHFGALRSEPVTFCFPSWFVAGKPRRASANGHRRGPSTSRISRP